MNKIAFSTGNKMISDILIQSLGREVEELYFAVRREMKSEFDSYITQKFDGPTAHEKKAEIYDKIDYTRAHKLIEEYKNKQELGQMLNKTKGDDISEIKNKNI